MGGVKQINDRDRIVKVIISICVPDFSAIAQLNDTNILELVLIALLASYFECLGAKWTSEDLNPTPSNHQGWLLAPSGSVWGWVQASVAGPLFFFCFFLVGFLLALSLLRRPACEFSVTCNNLSKSRKPRHGWASRSCVENEIHK